MVRRSNVENNQGAGMVAPIGICGFADFAREWARLTVGTLRTSVGQLLAILD
jgi:hypothetical protein